MEERYLASADAGYGLFVDFAYCRFLRYLLTVLVSYKFLAIIALT